MTFNVFFFHFLESSRSIVISYLHRHQIPKLFLYLALSIYIYIHIHLSSSLSIYLSINLFIYLSISVFSSLSSPLCLFLFPFREVMELLPLAEGNGSTRSSFIEATGGQSVSAQGSISNKKSKKVRGRHYVLHFLITYDIAEVWIMI